MKSAFGVEDSRVSKSAAMGSGPATMAEAHEAGKHAGKTLRHCPKCSPEMLGGANGRAVAEGAAKLARKAV